LVRHKFRLYYSTQKKSVLIMAKLSVADFIIEEGHFLTLEFLKIDGQVFSPSVIVLVLSLVLMREAR